MSRIERLTRTNRDPHAFGGGHRYTGRILPMETPRRSLLKAALDALNGGRV